MIEYIFEKEIYEDWLCVIFTKAICEAKNRNQILKAKTMAEKLGLQEGKDFFLIKDRCLTELEPEEVDKNGVSWTLTCIGFDRWRMRWRIRTAGNTSCFDDEKDENFAWFFGI